MRSSIRVLIPLALVGMSTQVFAAGFLLKPSAIARITHIECKQLNDPVTNPDDEVFIERNGKPLTEEVWEFKKPGDKVNLKNAPDKGLEFFSDPSGNVVLTLKEDDWPDRDDPLGFVTLEFSGGRFDKLDKPDKVTYTDDGIVDGLRTLQLEFSGDGALYVVQIEIEEQKPVATVCVQLDWRDGRRKATADETSESPSDELRIARSHQETVGGTLAYSPPSLPSNIGFYVLNPMSSAPEWKNFEGIVLPTPILGGSALDENSHVTIGTTLIELDPDTAQGDDLLGQLRVELRLVKTASGYDIQHRWTALNDVEFHSPLGKPVSDVTLEGEGKYAEIKVSGAGSEYHFVGFVKVLVNSVSCEKHKD